LTKSSLFNKRDENVQNVQSEIVLNVQNAQNAQNVQTDLTDKIEGKLANHLDVVEVEEEVSILRLKVHLNQSPTLTKVHSLPLQQRHRVFFDFHSPYVQPTFL